LLWKTGKDSIIHSAEGAKKEYFYFCFLLYE